MFIFVIANNLLTYRNKIFVFSNNLFAYYFLLTFVTSY